VAQIARFFSSTFPAVIPAIALLNRAFSAPRRWRWASRRPRWHSKTRLADQSSCFFQASNGTGLSPLATAEVSDLDAGLPAGQDAPELRGGAPRSA
jgi:hypothetical protein